MKKVVLLVVLLATTTMPLMSQERETVVGRGVTHGGFGGPELRFAELDDENTILAGAKGAWLIDHAYYLGLAGFGAIEKVGDYDLNFGYGGIVMGYIFPTHRAFTYSVEFLAGVGNVRDDNNRRRDKDDSVVVFEPAVYIQVNLARFANLNIGFSHRWVRESNTPGTSDDELSYYALITNFMFGSF